MRLPLCVHARALTEGATMLATLAAAEQAWTTLSGALGIPPPDLDPSDHAFHVHLASDLDEPSDVRTVARDVRSRIDRARGAAFVDARLHPGCTLDAAVARAIARAALLRSAPATSEAVARGQTEYLAELVAPCSLAFRAVAVSAFQSMPDRAVSDARAFEPAPSAEDDAPVVRDRASRAFADGTAVFWRRVDWAYGAKPGAVIMASWALSTTRTDVGSARWHDEPDAFDVLRESFKGALSTGSTLGDLLLDVAVARAFVGSADDGLHVPELRTLGDAGRVPLDWDLPWPATPRRLAPRAPVAPTGASYITIRLAGAPRGARLRVELSWEEHALFRWALVKLDASGRELGRVPIAARERATEAQMTLVDLEGVDRVLLVGTNVGDPAYRFDPDDEVWEPHGFLVTLAAE